MTTMQYLQQNQTHAKHSPVYLRPLSTGQRLSLCNSGHDASGHKSFPVIAPCLRQWSVRFSRRNLSVQCHTEDSTESMQMHADTAMTLWDHVGVLSHRLSMNFASIVLVSCCLALFFPTPFLWITTESVTIALAVSMLAMGCTLKVEDFAILARHPFRIIAGVLLQYTVMPLTGFGIAQFANLPTPLAAGIILVSCCPGGVASNIVTYLADGDLALSVAMTSVSTLLAIVLTPTLTALFMGTLVPVNGWDLFFSTLQVILMPLSIGLMIKAFYPKTVKQLQKIAPLVAVLAVTSINCSITAKNAAILMHSGMAIFTSVVALHIVGFSMGYFLAAVLKLPPKSCTTISIEVGMQNSGLGAVLAMKHFQDPLSCCVCVVSACFHSIFGGLLASFIRQRRPNLKRHVKQEDARM